MSAAVSRESKKFFRKLIYSRKSQYLLNKITLQISDPEIKKQYDIARCQNFSDLFYPKLIGAILHLLYRAYQILMLGVPYLKAIQSSQILILVVLLGICRVRLKHYAPLWIYFYAAISVTVDIL
jgi:hypothetical protein